MLESEEKRVLDNLPLVTYIVKKNGIYPSYEKKYQREFEDYLQQGYLGLCLAAIRFDESKGFKFATFATFYIDGFIKRYRRDCDTRMRCSRDCYDEAVKVYKLARKYELDTDSAEDLEIMKNMAEAADIDFDKAFMSITNKVESLNKLANEEVSGNSHQKLELGDLIASIDDELEYIQYIDLVTDMTEYVKNILQGRSAEVFEEYINDLVYSGIKLKQEVIAEKYGISQSYVARVLQRGSNLCKEYLIKYGHFREEDFNDRKRARVRHASR